MCVEHIFSTLIITSNVSSGLDFLSFLTASTSLSMSEIWLVTISIFIGFTVILPS
nr:MAG TPA: hypothetical protein [Caudoviricetes sp.]